MTEEWRSIPGLEGCYEASDLGRVRSLARVIVTSHGVSRTIKPRVLKPALDTYGYPILNINKKSRLVHQLVLLAFVGPLPPGLVTRHLNDVKTDCRLANLTYGTRAENWHDAVANGAHINAIGRNGSKTHCPRGHAYAGVNLRIRPNGDRECRSCRTSKFPNGPTHKALMAAGAMDSALGLK